MKKLLPLLLIQLFIGGYLFAQTELMIRNGDNGSYLEHPVAPKENFYSIGRLYNIHPKELSAYNNLEMAKGLSIGQVLRIPLTLTNFSQTASQGTPVFYKVGEKEGLYRVSMNNNKVLMENLRKWNNLSDDNVSTGSNIIVGYLISGEMQNAAANVPVKETVNQPLPATEKDASIEKEKQFPKTELVEKPPVKEIIQPLEKPTVKEIIQPSNTSDANYFKSHFDQQIKTIPVSKDQTVTAGIFKTASGWQDGKYYLLIDNVEPGMIIKVINPSNGKTIFAKVLGQMGGIRQNQGLNIRISNAAASTLQIEETDKFIVRVNY